MLPEDIEKIDDMSVDPNFVHHEKIITDSVTASQIFNSTHITQDTRMKFTCSHCECEISDSKFDLVEDIELKMQVDAFKHSVDIVTKNIIRILRDAHTLVSEHNSTRGILDTILNRNLWVLHNSRGYSDNFFVNRTIQVVDENGDYVLDYSSSVDEDIAESPARMDKFWYIICPLCKKRHYVK